MILCIVLILKMEHPINFMDKFALTSDIMKSFEGMVLDTSPASRPRVSNPPPGGLLPCRDWLHHTSLEL